MLQGYIDENSTDEDEDGVIYGLEEVIPEHIFEEFYEKVYDISMEQQKQLSSAKKANFQFEKIHNRAIFDSFNEALNVFRPYFLISTVSPMQMDLHSLGQTLKRRSLSISLLNKISNKSSRKLNSKY